MTAFAFLIPLANLRDLLIRKFGQVVSLAGKTASTTALGTLTHVVRVGTKVQVVGPNAKAVRDVAGRIIFVTRMANLHAVRDRAKVDYPRSNVSTYPGTVFTSSLHASISVATRIGSPQPARIRFPNLGPETLKESFGKAFCCENRAWVKFYALCVFALVRFASACNRFHSDSLSAVRGLLTPHGSFYCLPIKQ